MSESQQELGTPEASIGWEQALTETLKAASEPDPSTEKPAEPAPEVTSETAETGAEKVAESIDALQPLEKWPDEVKTRFATLDRGTQEFLLKRESDVETHLTKRAQELSDTQKRYERIDAVLKPYEEVARRQGIDITPVVAQAMQAISSYQRDPVSTLKQLIQASQLSQEQLFGAVNEIADPAIRALRTELDQTKSELANLKQGQSQAADSQYATQIQAFKDAKDEKGEAKHPYFERVREFMAPLVAQGKSLDDAYSEVLWMVPEHRQAVEKAARDKAESEARAKAEKARLEKVKNAKKAETLPASDASKGAAPKKARNWEEALRETLSTTQ